MTNPLEQFPTAPVPVPEEPPKEEVKAEEIPEVKAEEAAAERPEVLEIKIAPAPEEPAVAPEVVAEMPAGPEAKEAIKLSEEVEAGDVMYSLAGTRRNVLERVEDPSRAGGGFIRVERLGKSGSRKEGEMDFAFLDSRAHTVDFMLKPEEQAQVEQEMQKEQEEVELDIGSVLYGKSGSRREVTAIIKDESRPGGGFIRVLRIGRSGSRRGEEYNLAQVPQLIEAMDVVLNATQASNARFILRQRENEYAAQDKMWIPELMRITVAREVHEEGIEERKKALGREIYRKKREEEAEGKK